MAKIFKYSEGFFTAPYCDERDDFCPIIKLLPRARKNGECNYELNVSLDDLLSYCNKCTKER